jgi:hypothetical protein
MTKLLNFDNLSRGINGCSLKTMENIFYHKMQTSCLHVIESSKLQSVRNSLITQSKSEIMHLIEPGNLTAKTESQKYPSTNKNDIELVKEFQGLKENKTIFSRNKRSIKGQYPSG